MIKMKIFLDLTPCKNSRIPWWNVYLTYCTATYNPWCVAKYLCEVSNPPSQVRSPCDRNTKIRVCFEKKKIWRSQTGPGVQEFFILLPRSWSHLSTLPLFSGCLKVPQGDLAVEEIVLELLLDVWSSRNVRPTWREPCTVRNKLTRFRA